MTLRELIAQYRSEHGLSQRQFAAQCSLSNGYISMLEKGLNPNTGLPLTPTLPALKKLATGMGISLSELISIADDMPVSLIDDNAIEANSSSDLSLFPGSFPIDLNNLKRIPILGRIPAGSPMYAEEYIEGYTYTNLNGGHEYFGLKVRGDSMDAAGIKDGYTVIVRRQDTVYNGQIAVVLINGEDATLKRFSQAGDIVTLMPQSTNPIHQPFVFDLKDTHVDILGLVVKVEFSPV